MFAQIISDLGPWTWLIIGLVLLIGEAVVPGVFLMWFGLAGVVIGLLTLAPVTDVSWWPWQAQLTGFGVLSLIFILVGNKLFPSNSKDDEASKINDPLARFVGREVKLTEPIENGAGRVKLGDTTWRVSGPDIKSGQKVKVVGVNDGALVVEQM